ncbi:MAG: flagellar biosynthesis anti-sigma factor FlgM [Spirochaetes bacterium]|nr:flagellar biosynthesis anti-sigma factor FlgM [Spirochaetota bacterium]
MGIDKIGQINNYNGYNKINKKNSVKKTNSSDSVNISKEAIDMADTNKIMEIVKNAPDVRADKINEVKAKLNNPDYIDEAIANGLAEKIMEAFNV